MSVWAEVDLGEIDGIRARRCGSTYPRAFLEVISDECYSDPVDIDDDGYCRCIGEQKMLFSDAAYLDPWEILTV